MCVLPTVRSLLIVPDLWPPGGGGGGGLGTAIHGLYRYVPLCAVKGMVFKQFTLG